MSIEALNWAMKHAPIPTVTERGKPSPVAMTVVLLVLADFAAADGCAWPSVATIAARARTSERQVRYVLAELEELRIIRPGDPVHVQHHPRNARPKVWYLCIDGIHESVPTEEVGGAETSPLGTNTGVQREPLGVQREPLGVQREPLGVQRESFGGAGSSPNPLKNHHRTKREAREDKPEQSVPTPIPLSDDFQFDTSALSRESGLPEPVVEAELVKLRNRARDEAMTSADWHAKARWWLDRAVDYRARTGDFSVPDARSRLTPEQVAAKRAWIDAMAEENDRRRADEEQQRQPQQRDQRPGTRYA